MVVLGLAAEISRCYWFSWWAPKPGRCFHLLLSRPSRPSLGGLGGPGWGLLRVLHQPPSVRFCPGSRNEAAGWGEACTHPRSTYR